MRISCPVAILLLLSPACGGGGSGGGPTDPGNTGTVTISGRSLDARDGLASSGGEVEYFQEGLGEQTVAVDPTSGDFVLADIALTGTYDLVGGDFEPRRDLPADAADHTHYRVWTGGDFQQRLDDCYRNSERPGTQRTFSPVLGETAIAWTVELEGDDSAESQVREALQLVADVVPGHEFLATTPIAIVTEAVAEPGKIVIIEEASGSSETLTGTDPQGYTDTIEVRFEASLSGEALRETLWHQLLGHGFGSPGVWHCSGGVMDPSDSVVDNLDRSIYNTIYRLPNGSVAPE